MEAQPSRVRRKIVRGVYGYLALAAGVAAISLFHSNVFHVIVAAAATSVALGVLWPGQYGG